MNLIKLQSGLLAHRLNKSEQDEIWSEINKNISPVGFHSLFTPQDNIEYFIISEKEISFEKFEAKIKVGSKQITVKYNILNQDEKTFSAIRKTCLTLISLAQNTPSISLEFFGKMDDFYYHLTQLKSNEEKEIIKQSFNDGQNNKSTDYENYYLNNYYE